jgi:hypothetical protein
MQETHMGETYTQPAVPRTDMESRATRKADHRKSGASNRSLIADMVKGAVAGLAGVWLMDRIGWQMYLNEDPKAFRQEKAAQIEGKYVAHVAVSKMADFAGIERTPEQEYRAGKVMHYMLGLMPGAAYGALRKRVPVLGAGRGLLYGLTLFVAEDEILAPALGLASGPRAYPWQAHARGLVTHLVLGATTHATLDLLDRAR